MIARTTISINEHTNIPIEYFYTYAVPTFDFRVLRLTTLHVYRSPKLLLYMLTINFLKIVCPSNKTNNWGGGFFLKLFTFLQEIKYFMFVSKCINTRQKRKF